MICLALYTFGHNRNMAQVLRCSEQSGASPTCMKHHRERPLNNNSFHIAVTTVVLVATTVRCICAPVVCFVTHVKKPTGAVEGRRVPQDDAGRHGAPRRGLTASSA